MPEQTRTIGYICPVCGNAVIAQRTAFQLAAGNSVLPCPCGKSELNFRQRGDRCEGILKRYRDFIEVARGVYVETLGKSDIER